MGVMPRTGIADSINRNTPSECKGTMNEALQKRPPANAPIKGRKRYEMLKRVCRCFSSAIEAITVANANVDTSAISQTVERSGGKENATSTLLEMMSVNPRYMIGMEAPRKQLTRNRVRIQIAE